jgi:hypothetical protein
VNPAAGLAFALACAACDPAEEAGAADAAPDAAVVDAETILDATFDAAPDATPDATPAPGCRLEVPEIIVIKAGGRAHIDLGLTGETTGVAAGVPAGWRTTLTDDTLSLRVGYEVGTFPVTLQAACTAGGTVEAQTTVEVQPLAWTPLARWTPGDDGPPAREYFSMWINPLEPDRLWLFGGFHYEPRQFTTAWDLWSYELDREVWVEERSAGEPPHLAGGGLAVIPGEVAAFHYGGLGGGGSELPFSLYRFEHSGLPTWRPVTVADAPEDGTYQPAFFHDPRRGVFLTIGGQGPSRTHMDIRVFDPAALTWTPLAPAPGPAPSGRTGFFWAYDPETERFIAFGGEQGGQDSGCNCAQDTWALELAEDPPRWVQLAGPQDPPIGRRNGAYALDPLGHRLLVWGGTADGRTSFPGLYALDLDRGHEAWTLVESERPPPARASGGAVYDAARSRLLMGFGNGERVYADLWSLPLAP